MLKPKVSHFFRTGRPTKFSLDSQMEHEDMHHRQAPWPSRSKVKVARLRDASDRCWPLRYIENLNSQKHQNWIARLPTSRAIKCISFKVTRSNVKVTRTNHTDGPRRPVSSTSAMTSKVKGQGHKVKWSSDSCLPVSQEGKVPEISKLVLGLPMRRTIMSTSFYIKRSRANVTRPINAETESVS